MVCIDSEGRLQMLRKRSDFVRAQSRGRLLRTRFFLLRVFIDSDIKTVRIGFTITKKVGNAVIRNRVRRRLRALVSKHRAGFQQAGDYVWVVSPRAAEASFTDLESTFIELACRTDRVLKKKPE